MRLSRLRLDYVVALVLLVGSPTLVAHLTASPAATMQSSSPSLITTYLTSNPPAHPATNVLYITIHADGRTSGCPTAW
jgi:hypothetical protein